MVHFVIDLFQNPDRRSDLEAWSFLSWTIFRIDPNSRGVFESL